MSKRQKFVLTAIILASGLIALQLVSLESRYQAIEGLALLSYFLSAWALREDLKGIEWLTVLILPVIFTLSVGLFYFLIPASWLSRGIVAAVYALGLYALLLTENIFNVAAVRTIQLLRAAHSVGLLLTLLTAFFLFDTIFSLRFSAWMNFPLISLACLPLSLQFLWSIELGEKLEKKLLEASLIFSLCMGEIGACLSFWPVSVTLGSLLMTTFFYVLLGLGQHWLQKRLFEKAIKEYLWVGGLVFWIVFWQTKWG